jgi:diadenosine tetraphosphatase ApaH/serine/threonine PP2A family protein phosphatase
LYALISDIHANTEALGVVLDDIANQGISDILCLGDVIGYGPEPRECLKVIKERCRLFIMGNHEHGAMFDGTAADFNPRARAAIEWTKDQINSRQHPQGENNALWTFIDNMLQSHRENGVLLVHGSPRDPVREYMLPRDAEDLKKMAECYARMEDPLCFVGHSHVPGVYIEGEGFFTPTQLDNQFVPRPGKKAIVNIGSVGQPRDGDTRSSYVIFRGDRVEFRRLDYDYQKTMEKIRATRKLPEYLADRLAVGR